MKLIRPNSKFESSYRAYIDELGKEERYPFTLDLEYEDFDALLNLLNNYEQGNKLPEHAVPNTTLWLVDGEELLGVANIRHHLNDKLRDCGGHIGLGVRPSVRNQGLGSELMRLSIALLFEKGVQYVHVHCYKGNASSVRTIVNNGGELDSELTMRGETVLRYVIKK